MVINKKGWLCGKCLKIYKTKHEAFRCELRCLDEKKAFRVYNLFKGIHDSFKLEKGVAGYRFFTKVLGDKISESKEILNLGDKGKND